MRHARLILVTVVIGAILGAGIMFGVLALVEEDQPQSERERIEAAVERVYRLISVKAWTELWNMYTSDFKEQCSFEAMVRSLEQSQEEGVHSLEVSAFDDIDFLGNRAQVRYSIVGFDDGGRKTADYDYDAVLLKENGRWLYQEQCFPP